MTWREEKIGRARLILGDCRDVLPTLPKVDAVVTDPPYGIGADTSMAKSSGFKGGSMMAAKSHYEATDWDSAPVDSELMRLVWAVGHWQIIFGGNYYQCAPTTCWLVWDKEVNGHFADCELAWTNLPKAVRRIRHMWNGMLRKGQEERHGHPTQKPVEVMKWCIGHLPEPNDVILDPFMGSGTTGVAAPRRSVHRRSRRMIRVELPWPDTRLSPNARVHWRQKADATKTARQAAFVLGRAAGLKRVSTVPIGMDWTFCPPDRRHRDRDNAIASAKALADGLADALGGDDRHFVPTYRMGDPVKGGAVIVLVEVGP